MSTSPPTPQRHQSRSPAKNVDVSVVPEGVDTAASKGQWNDRSMGITFVPDPDHSWDGHSIPKSQSNDG